MEPLLNIGAVAIQLYLHVFANADAADLRHSQMMHGVTDSRSLWVKDRLFWFHDHVHFHWKQY